MSEVSITTAEWEVMRVIWAHQGVKSRQIIEILNEKMQWKPGTIKTLIGRLVKKDYISATKEGRAFVYRANVSEKKMIQALADDLFAMICDRDAGRLISYLVETQPMNQADIQSIQKQLTEKAKTAPEEVTCHCLPGQCHCHHK